MNDEKTKSGAPLTATPGFGVVESRQTTRHRLSCSLDVVNRGGSMAKRFTDNNKWQKSWFRNLTTIEKLAWIFLCDFCDHAGIWDIDEKLLEHYLGEAISIENLVTAFGDRIRVIDDGKLYIPSFAEFQYSYLNPDSRVHKSVLDRLQKLNITLPDSLSVRLKDKDKDKVKDKEKEKDPDVEWPRGAKERMLGNRSAVEAMRLVKTSKEGMG